MRGRLSKRKVWFSNIICRKDGLYKKKGTTRLMFCCILAALLIGIGNVNAKSPKKSDYVNIGLYGGYSTLLGKSSRMIVPGSLGAGLDIGYEYREGQVWLAGGAELSYLSSTCKSDIQIENIHFQDTRLTNAIMKYTMLSSRQEMQNMGVAKLYFMAGYCTGNHMKSGWYAGGGVKIGSQFDLYNTTKVSYQTQAEYDRYIEDYKDMPNHYYTTNTVIDTVSFGTKLYLSVWNNSIQDCSEITNILIKISARNGYLQALFLFQFSHVFLLPFG